MPWVIIAQLAAQYGIPFVEKLIANWSNNTPVTPEEWNILKGLAQNNALSMLKAALARAGIPETDPVAVKLIAQVPA